jgi:hypothetical protein
MLAEIYGSALSYRSDALLHLQPKESLTSHKKLKTFIDFPAIYIFKKTSARCVCVYVCVRLCMHVTVPTPHSYRIPTKLQDYKITNYKIIKLQDYVFEWRFRLAFKILNRVLLNILGPQY